jgi:ACS family hexuronate transporter-like MFS transporter
VPRIPLRWLLLGVFVGSSVLNYLDRQVLAALAPLLRAELHLSNTDYGLILSAFSIVYAAASPLAGLFIDRVGLTYGIAVLVALWSAAGSFTGATQGFAGMLACRAVLGVAQSGGVPATGKAIRQYLDASERALGNAFSQFGLSVGAMLAPLVATWLALAYGWRWAFLVTGLLGFFWIPLWLVAARRIPPQHAAPAAGWRGATTVLGDRRLWGFILANVLSMTVYSLWTNWTTVYLVDAHRLSLAQAARYAWIPPLVSNLGGVLGGWLSLRLIRRGVEPIQARYRVCLMAAVAGLATAAIPLAPSPWAAIALVSFSFFTVAGFSVNLYTMPLDVFESSRAAFSISLLTAAYGGMQTVVSPLIGASIDRYGFQPACLAAAVAPLAAAGVLKLTRRPA